MVLESLECFLPHICLNHSCQCQQQGLGADYFGQELGFEL